MGRTTSRLYALWPGTFDTEGIFRAKRVPLSRSFVMWAQEGDVDIDGNSVRLGQEAWYYGWYWGLHLLCGDEGFRAGKYEVRPS